MITVITCASTDQSITLMGEPIADSGEGKVWRTNYNPANFMQGCSLWGGSISKVTISGFRSCKS
ncbi:MAG: hypothetical protein V7L25_34995 [Nostoc sp.]